ncbi:MAG TPA: FKBP-type peptidyl-prolyl cis-trans isomerase [bacterium]|nr:FKBP-type peptidyl-prolyl cis-trans isomerase [bacterium]
MAMHVRDTGNGGGANHMQVRNNAQEPRAGREAGQAFLETFRPLPESRFRTTASGLKVAEVREGHGKPFTNGMKVKVKYTGWLEDGTKFDSSLDHGSPFEFTLGAGRVIKGWEEGLQGIRPGERRQLVIPASLGYGNRQVGDIPPGATLIFNVEAVAVEEPPANPKGTMNVVA